MALWALLWGGCALSFAQQTEPAKVDYKRFYVNAGADFTDYQLTRNFYAGLEYKLRDESSVGLNLFYKDVPFEQGYSVAYGTNYGFQLQANHDWAASVGLDTGKFDFYTGLNADVNFQESQAPGFGFPFAPFAPQQTATVNHTAFTVGGQLGLRYFFYKNLGVHVEANANRAVSGTRLDLGPNPRYIEIRTGLTYKF